MTSTKSAYEVVMPKLGLIMTEAMLVEWHKENQDKVEHGEVLFSLESDKTLVDIEAPASGFLSILVPAGTIVPVLTAVAIIAPQQGEYEPASAPSVSESPEYEVKSPGAAPQSISAESGSIRATPKARKLAEERKLQLVGIKGTGPRSMIVTADLDKVPLLIPNIKASPIARKLAAEFELDLTAIHGTGPGGRISREDVNQALKTQLRSGSRLEDKPVSPLKGLRGVIADRLSASWNERPQVTLYSEIDATNLVKLRKQVMETLGKISYNTFLLKACAQALVEYPHLNVQLTDQELISLNEIHIGLAVDTERGLMVPVIKNPDKKEIDEINEDLSDLVDRTLKGKLLPGEYSGGSFTITNLGSFGIDSFSPIINPPETAILGVGRIVEKPAARDGELIIRDSLTLSLSFDHRLIDGAPAAQFLHRICELLENPATFIGLDL
jgi:pyruvate dehydrogenase E2 component (dihydrolipoamide acetyltransferase)